VFAYQFHFGKSGFSAYCSRQIRMSGFIRIFCAGPDGPYTAIVTVTPTNKVLWLNGAF